LVRVDVRKAHVVISECTFIDPDHRQRAKIGNHLHIEDVAEWLPLLEGDARILSHLSRRNTVAQVRRELSRVVGDETAKRALPLMDHRANRTRYERQLAAVEDATIAAATE